MRKYGIDTDQQVHVVEIVCDITYNKSIKNIIVHIEAQNWYNSGTNTSCERFCSRNIAARRTYIYRFRFSLSLKPLDSFQPITSTVDLQFAPLQQARHYRKT